MCGIFGVVAVRGAAPSVAEGEARRLAGLLTRRGPDGEGTWARENVVLAHRRLIVRDPTDAGSQPMGTPDGRFQLVYNGELYNDAELRAELLEAGAVPGGFRSDCDTETVLWACATWGERAFPRLRGMFAVALYDRREHRLHLARDPLGIKPLYYHVGGRELAFASDPRPLLGLPSVSLEPNVAMVSAYLSTLRTVLGSSTLFRGVLALRPGQSAVLDARTGSLRLSDFHRPGPVDAEPWSAEAAAEAVRAALEDSVRRHLRADVPVCSLLSGGIDSSIVCRIVADHDGVDLRTWCAGSGEGGAEDQDLDFARSMAESLGSRHTSVRVDRELFGRDWPWMVEELGLPLSTPNEVAIHAVCRDLAARGQVVALSGEGADELFGGYEQALDAAAEFCRGGEGTGGGFQLEATAWIPTALKPHLVTDEVWSAVEGDAMLVAYYEELFARSEVEAGPSATPLDAHLRFLRHSNLTGLLQRLDTASMLASVEGRTPFADVAVAALADRLPMRHKLGPQDDDGAARGKRVLRDAWGARLPEAIVSRPKCSFPLPFQRWIADHAAVLERSPFARALFAPATSAEIAREPERYFQLAWPMINVALWGDRWWG